jgi:hypothetical protein
MKCIVDACSNPSRAKRGGMCNLHRMRVRHGTPLTGLNTKSDWGDKFLAYMNEGHPDECWEWTGPRNGAGYGSMNVARVAWTAHRLSYALHHGDIPDGAFVCHRCDNPPCVNPAHLYAGTAADNNRDREERQRLLHPVGEDVPVSVLTNQQVREIRSLVASGERHATLAARFGVCKATISHIVTGRNWSNVA